MIDKDKVIVQVVDESFVTVRLDEFYKLVSKAARLDAIADSIRNNVDAGKTYGRVDDDIVLLMTGTANYQPEKAAEPDE